MAGCPPRPGRRRTPLLGSLVLAGVMAVLALATHMTPLGGWPALLIQPPTPTVEAAAVLPSPTPGPSPTSPPPSPTFTPLPVLLPELPSPPATPSGDFLVLELASESSRSSVSEGFDCLRRRGIRTLVFASSHTHPDFLRLAIADGHHLGLLLDLNSSFTMAEVRAEVRAWERLAQQTVGPAWLPLALLPAGLDASQELRETLARLGYHLVVAQDRPGSVPGALVRVELGLQTATQLEALERASAARGRVLLPHWLALTSEEYPIGEDAATSQAFRASHIIVIDPGHTRVDVGAGIPAADGRRQSERWANLQRAQALCQLLQADGWTVVLTHEDEALFDRYADAPDVDLSGTTTRADDTQFRTNFVYYLGLRSGRRPVVISMHADSNASPDVWGPILFYPPTGDEALRAQSRRLALALQDHLAWAWENLGVTAPSRGVHVGVPQGRKGSAGSGYDILGTVHIRPAPGAHSPPNYHYVAVLVEAGTASHRPEGYVLGTSEGNRALAQAHREAINQWMMTEVALKLLASRHRCLDPASLTPEQVEFLAAQEVTSGHSAQKRVAFTFDAGASAAYWPQIRTALAAAGVRPTVFLTGIFIRQYPQIVRQMLADGYDLQSHSDTHPDLTRLTAAEIQAEFLHTQQALDEALGAHIPMCLWRPPFGARNAAVRRAAAELGLLEIYWSPGGDTTGWQEGVSSEQVIARVKANLHPGQIFVMHINSQADAEALPTLLAEAASQGYEVGDVWSVLTPEQLGPLP